MSPSGTVELWSFRLDGQAGPDCLKRCEALLDSEERRQASRALSARQRHAYLRTRAAVRTVLSHYEPGVSARDWRFARGEHGKPVITGKYSAVPLHFNLSHSGARLVIAVSLQAAVGVDVEHLARNREFIRIARRRFAADEAALLGEVAPDQLRTRFYELWTLKEAWLKALGEGLALPLSSFSVALPGGDGIALARYTDGTGGDWPAWLFAEGEEYRIGLVMGQKVAAGGIAVRAFDCPSLLDLDARRDSVMRLLRRTAAPIEG